MRQGRRYFWGMLCAVMTVTLAYAAPAMASRDGCFDKAKQNGKRAKKAGPNAESSQAIVLRRPDRTYWGCKFKNTRLRMLEGQTDGTDFLAKRIQVKRVHALYATRYTGKGKTITVYTFNIAKGEFQTSGGDTTFRDRDGDERRYGDGVTLGKNMILRNNGSIAWGFKFRSESDEWNRILALDSNGPHEFDSDESDDDFDREHQIKPGSLSLVEDSGPAATINWTRKGKPPIVRDGDLR